MAVKMAWLTTIIPLLVNVSMVRLSAQHTTHDSIIVTDTGGRLSSLESAATPTPLEQLRDMAQLRDLSWQLAGIAKTILEQQEQNPISTALEEISTMIQSQIERAFDLNDRMCVFSTLSTKFRANPSELL